MAAPPQDFKLPGHEPHANGQGGVVKYAKVPYRLIDDPADKLFARNASNGRRVEVSKLVALSVYVVISRYADWDKDTAFPSSKRIAELLGCSRSTVIDAVHALVHAGYLRASERKDAKGDNTSNLYTWLISRSVVRVTELGPRCGGGRSHLAAGEPSPLPFSTPGPKALEIRGESQPIHSRVPGVREAGVVELVISFAVGMLVGCLLSEWCGWLR
jgi:hypothetical protein